MQNTLRSAITFEGVGLHAGESAKLVISPAEANTGIILSVAGVRIVASYLAVEHMPLCTLLRGPAGISVSTVEHVMAALAALGIDNALIELDGTEMPIMDGSSAPFVEGILAAGIRPQIAPRRYAKVIKPVEVRDGESVCRLLPADKFTAEISINFANQRVGRQSIQFDGTADSFVSDFCMARTFCMAADIEYMHSHGRALGGSLDNAVVFDGDRILNEGGLRIEREPARHKMLDVVGDLALFGARIIGKFEAERPGHRMTNLLLRRAATEGALLAVDESKVGSDREREVCAA